MYIYTTKIKETQKTCKTLYRYFKHYKAYQVAFGLNINATDTDDINLPFTEIEATQFNVKDMNQPQQT